jgi:aspartate racemase
MKKTIGIMGGMGPEATAHMYDLILKNTAAARDQDHIHVIINSFPQVPPRTDAILGKGASPTAFLIDGIEMLKQAGADLIVIPCVTAHFFIPEVRRELDFELVNLLDESANWAKANIPDLKRAGIIASTGTLESRLFHNAFLEAGIEIITPDSSQQSRVMEAVFGIGGIKAGQTSGPPREAIVSVALSLIARGAEAVIAGCTEIPLVLKPQDISVPFIEPMRIAAEVCIRKAGYQLKSHP